MKRKILTAFVLFAVIIAMMTWMAKQGQKMTKTKKAPANASSVQTPGQESGSMQINSEKMQ